MTPLFQSLFLQSLLNIVNFFLNTCDSMLATNIFLNKFSRCTSDGVSVIISSEASRLYRVVSIFPWSISNIPCPFSS